MAVRAMSTTAEMTTTADPKTVIQVGLMGGLLGGVIIWIYEAVVWVGAQHLMPLAGIPRNATGLVFGSDVQTSLGWLATPIGTFIHFFFAVGSHVASSAMSSRNCLCWLFFAKAYACTTTSLATLIRRAEGP